MIHNLATLRYQSEQYEEWLDAFFGKTYHIRHTSSSEQQRGIDRLFGWHNLTFRVKYQTDWRAEQTGRAFIETVACEHPFKAGWAYTSQADRLVYYLPNAGYAYWLPFGSLRMRLALWKEQYPHVQDDQNTAVTGLIVPLSELDDLCIGRAGAGAIIEVPLWIMTAPAA